MFSAVKNRGVRAAILHFMSGSYTDCPAHHAISVLQEKWVMHIVRCLLDGAKGFNELGREVGGCNPTTLTQRLERLEALGLVSKEVCSVTPPKSSYTLTEAGGALQSVIDEIHAWATEYLVDTREAA